jgi:hypothetical protein
MRIAALYDIHANLPALEAVLKDEIIRMYQDVAENPQAEYHFYHGREAAELFGYEKALLDRAPAGALASFAGVGNPHLRSNVQAGETVPWTQNSAEAYGVKAVLFTAIRPAAG